MAGLGRKLDNSFFIALNGMCKRLGLNPEDVLVVMYLETRFDPNIGKPGRPAGLNQILPQYLKQFGFSGSADEFRSLNGEEQLPYIENYFRAVINSLGRPVRNAADLYMANLWPAGLKYPGVMKGVRNTPIITKDKGKAFSLNAPQMDFNKDGVITYGDFIDLTNDVKRRPEFRQVYVRFRNAVGNGYVSHNKPHQSGNILTNFFRQLMSLLDGLTSSASQNKLPINKYGADFPLNRYLIYIDTNNDFSSKIEFARILSSALKEEIDATTETYSNGNDVEIQCIVSAKPEIGLDAIKELSAVLSNVFEYATKKIGGIQVFTSVMHNEPPHYQKLGILISDTNYTQFHSKFIGK